MSDLIRRSDALWAIWGDDINPSEDGVVFEAQSHIDRGIRLIQSADRPQGEWILHFDDIWPEESTIQCSLCREHQPMGIDENFCPNCGADMTEREGE